MSPKDLTQPRRAGGLAALLGCIVMASLPVSAAPLIVDNTAGSLDQAIADANAATDPPNTITFPSLAADSTVQIASGALTSTSQLTIDAKTVSGIAMLGDGTTFLTVGNGTKLTLRNVAFQNGALLLESGSTATFEVAGPAILINDIVGDAPLSTGGILEKTGGGILKLNGANTFSGSANIAAGTLQIGHGALSADASIASGARLLFLHNPDDTYAGDISGMGKFEKDGTSVLTLTGTNTYSGGTTITNGTLAGANGAIQGDVLIQSGAFLELVEAGTSSYADDITGSGTLLKSGAGTLALTGTGNSWANAQITDGILSGDTSALSGNVDIGTLGTLRITEATSGTISGALSGDGLIELLGNGTVRLTGNNAGLTNTTASAITITGGTLIGNTSSIPTRVTVGLGQLLVFDQATDASYDQRISGSGGNFEKRGKGALTFSLNQSYDGMTTISAGRLNILGNLASDTVIANGATLGGTGTSAGSVTTNGNSAVIAPGMSIGTLSVDSVSFASGGKLRIEVDSFGADQLAVTNNADLTSGILDIQLIGGPYTNQVETILSAGSITGNLSIQSIFPLVDITMQTFANSVQLTLNSNGGSIGTLGSTPNQRAVGSSLDLETASATGDLSTVITSFNTLTAPEFSAALDSLSGETLSQFATARLEHAYRFDNAIHSRLREASDSLDRTTRRRAAPRGEGLLPEVSAAGGVDRVDLWFAPYTALANIDGNKGESDLDYILLGGAIGVEAAPFAHSADSAGALRDVRMGAAFAYGNSDIDFDDRDASASANSYMGALYAGWARDRYRAGLSGRVGYSQMDSARIIRIGMLSRRAEADFDGLDFGAMLEGGGKWIETERYLLESYGSLDYSHLERSTVREAGGGAVSLRIQREELDSLRVGIGTRLRGIFEMEEDTWILPELRAEWHQELLDRDRVVDASFVGATAGSSFSVRGATLQSHSANVGVGWTVRSADGFEAALDYDFGIGTDRLAHALRLRVGTHW